jgi:DNA-binding NtrC family response regulator
MDAADIAFEGYGAIPDEDMGTLHLEMAQGSILFGHEKGAFAIPRDRRLGLLQICSTGTVAVENVDKLTSGVQQKLHDFLEHGTFETVGGQKSLNSSAKIIVTSSKNLDELVHAGLFDAGLAELLLSNVMTVPPIRKRKSDLRLLVDFLIIMECFKTPDRKLIKGISPEAYQRIMEYEWPGNMDELQIVIRRAINLAQGDYLMPEDIFIGIAPPEGKYTINLISDSNSIYIQCYLSDVFLGEPVTRQQYCTHPRLGHVGAAVIYQLVCWSPCMVFSMPDGGHA